MRNKWNVKKGVSAEADQNVYTKGDFSSQIRFFSQACLYAVLLPF